LDTPKGYTGWGARGATRGARWNGARRRDGVARVSDRGRVEPAVLQIGIALFAAGKLARERGFPILLLRL